MSQSHPKPNHPAQPRSNEAGHPSESSASHLDPVAQALNEQWQAIRARMQRKILGQTRLIDRILITLLADGHILVEGAPGLAKTRAIKALADNIEASFHRIQFTPDLLPADITGTDIYRPQTGAFTFQSGPIFHNLILADEINRAPAKVQSALLEAMGEHQVSVGKQTYPLPAPFLVMATQNPIEQEGTYPLPEAQLDRFLMHVEIGYPGVETEQAIMRLAREEALRDQVSHSTHGASPPQTQGNSHPTQPLNHLDTAGEKLSQAVLFASRKAILSLTMVPEIENYIVALIMATRAPQTYSPVLGNAIEFGISPRGTIAMERCARAHAWLSGRDYVTPEDVQAIAHDVMRHRFTLSFEAQAQGMTKNHVITTILDHVAAP